MAKKEAKLNSIQITQQFEDGMWGNGWENWAEDIRKSWQVVLQQALDAARAGDISKLTEMIRELFEGTGHHLRDCYGILHNQDVREVWSELEGQMVVEPKPAHGHWVLYFKQGCGCTYAEAAAILGLPVQQIEKTKPGRYGYDNSLAYLVHAKYADKHQYDPKAVCTACGHPYTEIAGERMADWLKGRSSIARQKALDGIDDLEQQILDGRVTRQQVLLTDEYYAVYARNKRRCDDAFDTYASRKAYKTIQALDNGEFRLSVFFLTGRAGDGKTRLAKSIIKKLIAESAAAGNRWQVCKTAASNPVDDYCGEEILWMDDVRGTAMSASDWLKLLDPENITSSSARYHNKQVACRCILITSEKDVMEFFMYCRQMGGDTSWRQWTSSSAGYNPGFMLSGRMMETSLHGAIGYRTVRNGQSIPLRLRSAYCPLL